EVLLDDDPGRCLKLLAEAVRLADSVDNRFLGGVARVTASSVSARCGDPDEAADAFVAVTRRWREQRNLTHLLTTLRNVVVLFQRLDAAVEAAQLLGAVTGGRVKPSFGREAELLTAADEWVEAALSPAEAARQRALGAARGIDEAAQAAVEQLTVLRARRLS
nr:hypothetical protein [Micromonospora sp. DSM 115978]